MKTKIVVLLVILSFSLPVLAARWESLVSLSNKEGTASVYLDRQTVKTINKGNEKLINFWLRSELNNKVTSENIKAVNRYEVNCNTKAAFIVEENIKVYKGSSLVANAEKKETKKLQGKQYYDLENIMKQMCSEY
ncbi:MAG: hypothetical protein AB7V50_03765 [Vampirovibrionia bacterium]